jgi:dihydrofolate reductase
MPLADIRALMSQPSQDQLDAWARQLERDSTLRLRGLALARELLAELNPPLTQQHDERPQEVSDMTTMRPLRYSISVTLDGCCDHRAIPADEDLHRHAVENFNQADALILGRVTYEMMESAWRPPVSAGARPDWMEPFVQRINATPKYVVSSTLEQVDWNAEFLRGDLGLAVQQLKRESGKGLLVGGVKLPLALAELGLIDEYEFVVHPRVAGHGPGLFAGLAKTVNLKLVSQLQFSSGAVAMQYQPRR